MGQTQETGSKDRDCRLSSGAGPRYPMRRATGPGPAGGYDPVHANSAPLPCGDRAIRTGLGPERLDVVPAQVRELAGGGHQPAPCGERDARRQCAVRPAARWPWQCGRRPITQVRFRAFKWRGNRGKWTARPRHCNPFWGHQSPGRAPQCPAAPADEPIHSSSFRGHQPRRPRGAGPRSPIPTSYSVVAAAPSPDLRGYLLWRVRRRPWPLAAFAPWRSMGYPVPLPAPTCQHVGPGLLDAVPAPPSRPFLASGATDVCADRPSGRRGPHAGVLHDFEVPRVRLRRMRRNCRDNSGPDGAAGALGRGRRMTPNATRLR